MTYRVLIQATAQTEMEAAYRWIRTRSPARAARWYWGLVKAILSLDTMPERCAFAPETDAFDIKIRQLLYGKRGGVYRVLFTIQDDMVSVLHVRHGAQRFLEPGEPPSE